MWFSTYSKQRIILQQFDILWMFGDSNNTTGQARSTISSCEAQFMSSCPKIIYSSTNLWSKHPLWSLLFHYKKNKQISNKKFNNNNFPTVDNFFFLWLPCLKLCGRTAKYPKRRFFTRFRLLVKNLTSLVPRVSHLSAMPAPRRGKMRDPGNEDAQGQ